MENFKPTYAQLGTLLIAVGIVMQERGLCAGAALDGGSDEQLVEIMMERGVDEEIAKHLLTLDLGVVIDFIDF